MFERKSCVSLMLALGLLTAPALAQQAAQPGHHPGSAMMGAGGSMMGAGGMPMMGAGGWQRMMAAGGMEMMSAMAGYVEGRLAFLKTELKITDAQLPLWNKFADALRDNAKTMGKVDAGQHVRVRSQSATLPDRLATREKFLIARLETPCAI